MKGEFTFFVSSTFLPSKSFSSPKKVFFSVLSVKTFFSPKVFKVLIFLSMSFFSRLFRLSSDLWMFLVQLPQDHPPWENVIIQVQGWKPILVPQCHPVVVLVLRFWTVFIPLLKNKKKEEEMGTFPSQTRITIVIIRLTMMISWTHSNGIKWYVIFLRYISLLQHLLFYLPILVQLLPHPLSPINSHNLRPIIFIVTSQCLLFPFLPFSLIRPSPCTSLLT